MLVVNTFTMEWMPAEPDLWTCKVQTSRETSIYRRPDIRFILQWWIEGTYPWET